MLKVITDNPGIIAGDLGPKVKALGIGFQRGDERQAARRLVDQGKVRIVLGKRKASITMPPTTPRGPDPSRLLPPG